MSTKHKSPKVQINNQTADLSVHEITIIDGMVSFLEENGASSVEQHVLHNIAKSLTKRVIDTSPGTLQDVTMDNPYGVGYRSPCMNLNPYQGNISPASQGRSVREFEEQMAALRKENFNLKLRLFFIEESIPGYQHAQNSGEGPETIMKQLIDSKVQMEILRKELQEKQDLLKEAAQAMNQMEKIQQETEAKSESMLEELRQKIQYLELEKDIERTQSSGELMDNLIGRANLSDNVTTIQKLRELEGMLKQSDERILQLQTEMVKLNDLLAKRNETIKELEEKVKEQAFQNAELMEQLEFKEQETANSERKIIELRRKNSELLESKRNLTAAFEKTKNEYAHRVNNMNDECEQQMREQQHTLSNMKLQNLRHELQTYKTTLADKLCMLQEAEEKLENTETKLQERMKIHENACRTIQKLTKTIVKQDEKIIKLQTQQNVTTNSTNELQLENHLSSSDNDETKQQQKRLENIIQQQETVIAQLQAQSEKQTTNLQSLVNNELWEKNREIERLTKLVTQGTQYSPSLANDSNNADNSAELQKLLVQCDLVVADQELMNKLRQDAEQARSEAEQAEEWRRECAEVCTVLSTRLEELAGFLNSLLQHKDVLGALAADRRSAIRKAVDKSLDLSKSLNMTLSISRMSMCEQSLAQLSNLSDILGDIDGNHTFNSQEDQHDIETLRAENKALKRELDKRRHSEYKKDRRSLSIANLDNQSESEAWSEPDRLVSLARMGLDEPLTAVKELGTATGATADTDSDKKVLRQQNRSTAQKVRMLEQRIAQLEQIVAERDEHILELQNRAVETDNRMKREKLRVLELEKTSSSAPQSQALEELQEEHARLSMEARLAELQIDGLKTEMEELRQQHTKALQDMKQQLETTMKQRLEKLKQQHAEELQQNWVERCLHEKLQQELRNQQFSLENLLEQEEEYKQSLLNAEMTERALKKQLDENTIQASKAVMERNKAVKEKLQLEQRVLELQQRLQLQDEKCAALQHQINLLESIENKTQSKEQSGYSSEEIAKVSAQPAAQRSQNVTQRGNNMSSPDLGIESDAGRFSSGVESSRPINTNAELQNLKEDLSDGPVENMPNKNAQSQQQASSVTANSTTHDCAKVEQENAELRRKLTRTKRAFEDTYEKLRIANQKKAQIEKDIKSQILKTHNVLKNVRSNMENEQ